jgi:hypothetical protein
MKPITITALLLSISATFSCSFQLKPWAESDFGRLWYEMPLPGPPGIVARVIHGVVQIRPASPPQSAVTARLVLLAVLSLGPFSSIKKDALSCNSLSMLYRSCFEFYTLAL